MSRTTTLTVLALVVSIAMMGCKKKRDDSAAGESSTASGLPLPGMPGIPVLVNQPLWDRIEVGMSRAEVEKILGPGSVATPVQMDRLYVNLRGGQQGRTWQQHSMRARVKTWYGWVNGSDAIHVGFIESPRYGELAVAKLAVFHVDGGTVWLTLANPPDGIELTREQILKVQDGAANPKWAKGTEARKLLSGRWQQIGSKRIYHFLPDGTLKATGDWYKEVSVPYKFIDDEHIEFSLPNSYREDRPPPQTYKFVLTKTEMTLWWKFGELRHHGDFTRLPNK